MTSFNSIAVIGAGAWGTALAGVAARAGRNVILCVRSAEAAKAIAATRSNPKLPGITLHAGIEVTDDIARAAAADAILIATPAQNLRAAVSALAPHLTDGTPLVACAKGIERGTHKFMTEVIAEAAPKARAAILSGPGFADDVARGLPTAVTLAAARRRACEKARSSAGIVDVPALPHDRCPRRRDRRRGQERAGDRGWNFSRQKTRRLRAGRADHARLFGTGPFRPRIRRALRNADGPVGTRRPDPDLLDAAIAQFRAGSGARTRRAGAARQTRRRRLHGAGAGGTGGGRKMSTCRFRMRSPISCAARPRSTMPSKAC